MGEAEIFRTGTAPQAVPPNEIQQQSASEAAQEQSRTVENYGVLHQLSDIISPVRTTAGRLRHYLKNWKKFTSGKQILQMVLYKWLPGTGFF